MPIKIFDYHLGDTRGALASAIAIDANGERPALFGQSAFDAPDGYSLVTNWKLLLGRTELQIRAARSEDPALDRALQYETLESITEKYFGYLFSRLKESNQFEKAPEFIVGIPSANVESDAARRRYRRVIEHAFSKLKAPKPRFFPEPFAVFQYHWFNGDLEDLGRPHNVMIVDIGGGTTNVCVIQTSGHGRLARAGDNHKPHGVATFDKGGSDIDGLILSRIVRSTRIREVSKASLSARLAKEHIASELNRKKCWLDEESSKTISATVSVENQGDWTLTGHDLSQIIQHRFWPDVKATIEASLADAKAVKLAKPIEDIDTVIFAGGTCQIDLLRDLFDRDFGKVAGLTGYRAVLSPQYDRAVAGGLAIEACANSRLHETKPTRIAPYLQSSINFEVGHSIASIGSPIRLRLSEGPKCCDPQEGKIFNAPISVSELIGQKLEWQFRFQQPPHKAYLRFIQEDEEEIARLQPPISVQVAPKDEQAGSQCRLRMLFNDDGVADVDIIAWNGEREGHVVYPATRLDLHDLNAMEGEVFLGLDFGTTNTFICQVDASSITNDALPSKYRVDAETLSRAKSLHEDALAIIAKAEDPSEVIERYEAIVLKDYVYHSNRIEGSILTRGQTINILEGVNNEDSLHLRNVQNAIERVTFIDDAGEVRTIARPIKDEVAAVNLRDAFRHVQHMAAESTPLTPFYLKAVHNLIARGDVDAKPGQFRRSNVRIGQTSFVPPDASQVEFLVEEMCQHFGDPEFLSWPAIYQALYAHARFVSIHPFQDGNGRLARLVANYFLWHAKMPSVMLPWENRERYYDALEECNSFETSSRGDLTDLTTLFCDLFEDSLTHLSAIVAAPKTDQKEPLRATDEPIVGVGLSKSTRLNALLSRIGESKRAFDVEGQYAAWKSSFQALLGEVKEATVLVDAAYREGWGGAALLREFPIVDVETFRAMRDGRAYSRTWYFNLKLLLPKTTEDLVFFFGRASKSVSELESKLDTTASLTISRMVRRQGRYVNAHQEEWSRIKEITHDGTQMGVCLVEDRILKHLTDKSVVSDWFAVLMEDVTQELGGYVLPKQ